MIHQNLLTLIGDTPLIKINNFDTPTNLYGKLEAMNPGGSVKDRTAYGLICQAEKDGILKKGGTIAESTSGNLGLSLAMISAIMGYKFIAVLDPKVPQSNLNILKAYGAKVVMVNKPDSAGGYQIPRIHKVQELVDTIPGCINLDQYNNGASRLAHYHTTGPEIFKDLDGKVDMVVGAISTGGHLCGTAQYLKEVSDAVIVGVEPEGSVVFGGQYAPYKQNGTGLCFVPGNYISDSIDIKLKVSDKDAFLMTRKLASEEGLLVGASSGGVFHIALELASVYKKGANIVSIFADGGFKYSDTAFSDEWMQAQGFMEE